ncbi:aminopeptidase P N-terminal domain-containing protein [uncultured Propionivibrio sp.]|uniref:aminopeptidase P N-terminal domain-containing protein n=1 Tax=uncultured Propionivibrio sp. TaxID=426737 RepID=UPI0029C0F691|nr:aminopeptidase P N-terminal domain-containing protein [uncultured Propionivibrio sp.]
MNTAAHAARRRALFDRIGDGIAILPTAAEKTRNRDTHYPYRFDSDFWYLSNFPEPDAILVLVGGTTPRTILFCREKDAERETWDGFRYGPAATREVFGVDEAYPCGEFDTRLPDLLAGHPSLWFTLGHDAGWDARITAALNAVRAQCRAGKQAPTVLHDLRREIERLRRVKDATEIGHMRHAAAITSAGHVRAMQRCRPGQPEYALEAELSHEFRVSGATGHAYPPIVAGGAGACVLHYVNNDQPLADGSLVLIDAGCEVEGYAADITRTFPVNGRFTSAQRDVYEIVLAAQAAAIAALRPGASFIDDHDAAVRVLVRGLVDLGILHGEVDGLIEQNAYQPYYMHRTGHWLGLDVHDAGEYKDEDQWARLEAGMVLTVEPGLYLRADAVIPEALRGIGIRIEDDVLITANGADVYTTAPKSVADIEALMRHD